MWRISLPFFNGGKFLEKINLEKEEGKTISCIP